MSTYPRSSVSVQGHARVRQRPSSLLMIGKVVSSEATLELALKNLGQKRAAVSRWLQRLESQRVEFGEPRFPEQTEPDPMRMAQGMTRQRRRQRATDPAPETHNKTVLVSYSAVWAINAKSSDEVLIFVDRIQFEAADLGEPESVTDEAAPRSFSIDPVDPVAEMQSMMEEMVQPTDGDETNFLFLSCLSASQYTRALADAFKDAQAQAEVIAHAAGADLGGIHSIHSTSSHFDAMDSMNQMHRRSSMPMLSETPYQTPLNARVSENPQPAEFVVSVHLTYELK